MIELLFANILSAPASIKTLCGTRIFPLVIPEGSPLPAIEYSFIGGSVSPTFDTNGTSRLRVEVNCWGATYSSAVTLRAAVVESIDGYADQGINIQYLMPRDLFDHSLLQYRAIAEFYVYAAV